MGSRVAEQFTTISLSTINESFTDDNSDMTSLKVQVPISSLANGL